MKIALASPHFPKSVHDGLSQAAGLIEDAANAGAEIICFPETYIPGYPASEYNVQKASYGELETALTRLSELAIRYNIAVIMAMDWYDDGKFLNVAYVIAKTGEVLGYQAKNQLDPSEDNIWLPGDTRQIFEVNGLKFGIVICHEGFRYPEATRWAARHGARLVFHPHFSGSDQEGVQLTEWGHKDNPYYEKAMMMRAIENTIYFASVGYATSFQESATCVVGPDGKCVAQQPYGKAGVLIADIDLSKATGLLANRFKPDLYL